MPYAPTKLLEQISPIRKTHSFILLPKSQNYCEKCVFVRNNVTLLRANSD